MARHAIAGGLATAIIMGVAAGFAFGRTHWALGIITAILYATVGILVWADAVRKVSLWRRKQRTAERMFSSPELVGVR